MKNLKSGDRRIIIFQSEVTGSIRSGFTLLEVMISLAIVGGLLITLIYTLNYHLGIADRQRVITIATNLAKSKIYEIEKQASVSKGYFQEPYAVFSYETFVKDSSFPGMTEIAVTVSNEKETITLFELIKKKKQQEK